MINLSWDRGARIWARLTSSVLWRGARLSALRVFDGIGIVLGPVLGVIAVLAVLALIRMRAAIGDSNAIDVQSANQALWHVLLGAIFFGLFWAVVGALISSWWLRVLGSAAMFLLVLVGGAYVSDRTNMGVDLALDEIVAAFPGGLGDGRSSLVACGTIGKDFPRRLTDAIAKLPGRHADELYVSLDGGDINAAFQASQIVQRSKMDVVVRRSCNSACALIAFAGEHLRVEEGGAVGVHRASIGTLGKGTEQILSDAFARQLAGLGAAAIVIQHLSMTEPGDIYYLSASDLSAGKPNWYSTIARQPFELCAGISGAYGAAK